jgi:hypothetical protein
MGDRDTDLPNADLDTYLVRFCAGWDISSVEHS